MHRSDSRNVTRIGNVNLYNALYSSWFAPTDRIFLIGVTQKH